MENKTQKVAFTLDDTMYQLSVTKLAKGFEEVKILNDKLEQADKNIRILINRIAADERYIDECRAIYKNNEYYDNMVKELKDKYIVLANLFPLQTEEKQSDDKILNQSNKTPRKSNNSVTDLCEHCEYKNACGYKFKGKVDECEIFRKHNIGKR